MMLWHLAVALIKSTQPAKCGAIAQLGERIVRNDEVVGSIPTSSTKTNHLQATISNHVPFTSHENQLMLVLRARSTFARFSATMSIILPTALRWDSGTCCA